MMAISNSRMDLKRSQISEFDQNNNNNSHNNNGQSTNQANSVNISVTQNVNMPVILTLDSLNTSEDLNPPWLGEEFSETQTVLDLMPTEFPFQYSDTLPPIAQSLEPDLSVMNNYSPLDESLEQLRTRHDSYSSSIYSPGPSSLGHDYSFGAVPSNDYENSTDGSGQDNNANLLHNSAGTSKRQTKVKCMSKNAVMARANREKKKMEARNMAKRIQDLSLQLNVAQHRISELEKQLDIQNRQTRYYRSLAQNMPELAVLVEHVGTKVLPDE